MPIPIRSLRADELDTWLAARGQPSFRSTQILEWVYERHIVSFAECTNLPGDLRTDLGRSFAALAFTCCDRRQADDGTVKWLLRLADGETIETVLIAAERRQTVCISTQVGCAVRCAFCASGRSGHVRDLSAAEIIDQVAWASHELQRRVDNVVVMGIGEPLHNLDNLLPALQVLGTETPRGLGIGSRHITISTSGIVPGIRRLAAAGHQWNLALSLHAATDDSRARLIPDAHRYPLADILRACAEYREKTGRMITLEYALIEGINDSHRDIQALARIARDLRAKINLIPCNPTVERFHAPSRGQVRRLLKQLSEAGARVTVRQRRGSDIQAACGQLRQQSGPGMGPDHHDH